MGGNAHPSHPPPSRLTNDQHTQVITTLTTFFTPHQCFTHLISPHPAPEKQSHGDVDLLAVLNPSFPQSKLTSTLVSAGLYDARDHSYLYNLHGSTYQVDLTSVSQASLELELFMRSYGDVSAIVGAYARRLGYKLSGPKGLQARLQLPLSGEWKVYDLTRDVREICEKYLKLDYARWRRGFETEAELFEWLGVTAWYLRDEKGTTKRKRDMFLRFQNWCRALEQCPEQPGLWERLEEVGKAEVVRTAFEKDVKREAEQRAWRSVFNGAVVSGYVEERYGFELKGPKLGEFMEKVRLRLPKDGVPNGGQVREMVDAVWASGELSAAL